MRTLAAIAMLALLSVAARADGPAHAAGSPATLWTGGMDKGAVERTIAALEVVAKGADASPTSHEWLVRARYFQASERMAEKSDEQYEAFEAAFQAGLQGIGAIDKAHGAAPADADELDERLPKLDKACVGVLFWTSVSYGSHIPSLSYFRQAGAARRFKRMIECCLALDETYFHGGPHRVLAGYLAGAPGFMGGDTEAAREHCERAVLIDPKYADNYAQRADSAWKPAKDKAKYLADVANALALPDEACPDAVPEQIAAKKRAAKMKAKVDDVF